MSNQNQSQNNQNQSDREKGGSSNFKNDPNRAREAGRKEGEQPQGGRGKDSE